MIYTPNEIALIESQGNAIEMSNVQRAHYTNIIYKVYQDQQDEFTAQEKEVVRSLIESSWPTELTEARDSLLAKVS